MKFNRVFLQLTNVHVCKTTDGLYLDLQTVHFELTAPTLKNYFVIFKVHD